MRPPLYLRGLSAIALLLSPCMLHAARQGTVSKVAIVSNDPFQLQIQTNGSEAPQTQMVSSPERLVVDIPNTLPGPALRGIAIKSGEVRGIRVSLFSTAPPVTRIVVDLNQPQWYRVTPNATGLLVSVGSDSVDSVDTQSTIGWVSTKMSASVKPASIQSTPFEVRKRTVTAQAPVRKGLSIEFADGLMTIHSGGATLSEILFQIQKVTGAEIAIPSGTEQDRVAADFGPGPASEVLGKLLNGSGLNFVVVGSEANPNQLRSVILSKKSEGTEGPSGFAQTGFAQNSAPPTAENVEAEYQEAPPPDPNVPPPPDQIVQPNQNGQPSQPVTGDPSPDAPQN